MRSMSPMPAALQRVMAALDGAGSFAFALDPTLRVGIETMLAAAGVWLVNEGVT